MSALLMITFSTIVSIVLGLMHFAVYKAIVSIFAFSLTWRIVVGIILAILALSFIIASILAFNFDNSFVRIFYTISASWLGIAAYLLLASCVYGVVVFASRFFAPEISFQWFGMVCMALAVFVSVYGLIHARSMIVKTVQINIPSLPAEWQGRRAVWISDIHLGAVYGQDFAQKIVTKINDINPDIVFVGGDLYDGTKIANEVETIKSFSDLHPILGTYFITGNHEEFRDNRHYLDDVKKVGMRVLNNEMVNIDGVQIIGVDDRDSIDAKKFQTIMSSLNIDKTKPVILLKHQPSQLNTADLAGVSLQISGHTHKAQIFPLNIFTTLIFKGYDYGLNMWDKMSLYTSSGVGTWGPPMRAGSDSEIVVFEFR